MPCHQLKVSLLAIAALALAPAAAQASPAPITIGAGTNPVVAVGSDGTSHIAYEQAGTDKVAYCRLPAGATACATSIALPFPVNGGTEISDLNVFQRSGTVYIFGHEQTCANSSGSFDDVVEYVSNTTPVTSFAGPYCRNSKSTYMATGSGYLDASGQFVTGGGSDEDITTLPSGTSDFAINPTKIFTSSLYPALSVSGDSTHVVAAGVLDPGGAIRYSVFNGPVASGDYAAQNTSGNWTKDLSLSPDEAPRQGPDLVGGVTGTWMAYITADANPESVELLHLLGSGSSARFENPVAPTTTQPGYNKELNHLATAEANNGDLITTFTDINTGFLRYASRSSAHAFTELGSIADVSDYGYGHPQVAANADQQGLDVWDNDTNVYALPLTPTADVTPVPTPTPTPTPTPIPPAPKPNPTPTPIPTTPPVKTTTVHDSDGSSISFGTPTSCVKPGATFTVTLGFKKSKKKGALYVKVTKVEFSIQGSKVKTDKKAPFKQTLTVTASTKKGSKVTVRARAYIKVHHGKTPKKSVHASVSVCS